MMIKEFTSQTELRKFLATNKISSKSKLNEVTTEAGEKVYILFDMDYEVVK